MKILIVDDHPLTRRGVREILEDEMPSVEVREAGTAKELFEYARAEPWDLILLDISLPDKSGLDCLADLKRLHVESPVLILSAHAEEVLTVPALKSGAAGFLNKERAPEELIFAIKRVMKGHKYMSIDVAEQLARELSRDTPRLPHEALSEREFRVMRLIAAGMSIKDIASDLFLSPKTVSTYRARVMEKMNVKTNADLTLYCMQNGLLH